jgi:hypothetical protein
MRAMMKKRGISAAFVAVLLVTAALITSCSTPDTSKEEERLPKGMGGVKISFADTVELTPRATILPPNPTISGFLGGFTLTFTPSSGPDIVENIPQGGSNPTIPLAAGSYTLLVVAYLGPTPYTIPAATYVPTSPIVIEAGKTQNINITLTAIADGDGEGIFAWNINNQITPSLVTKAEVILTPITPPGIGVADSIDLTSEFQAESPTQIGSSKSIKSGYYYVDFDMEVKGIESKFRHILQVYQNMTSTLNYTFGNAHFSLGMARITPTPSYTHPTDIVPTFGTVTFGTGTLEGLGVITVTSNPATGVYDPYKLSLTSTPYPNTIIIPVSNRGSFDTVIGSFGTIVVAEGSSVDTDLDYGVFTLELGTSPLDTVTAGVYQFMVTGTKDGKTYGSAEIFIEVNP